MERSGGHLERETNQEEAEPADGHERSVPRPSPAPAAAMGGAGGATQCDTVEQERGREGADQEMPGAPPRQKQHSAD